MDSHKVRMNQYSHRAPLAVLGLGLGIRWPLVLGSSTRLAKLALACLSVLKLRMNNPPP
jgi:hypothetical protein